MYIIAFEGNLFLLVPSMTNCLSSHFSLEDPLMSSSVMFDPSCYGFALLEEFASKLLIYDLPFKDILWKHDLAKEQYCAFNASISNVARLLWLFERMDSRKTLFKREVDGMTRDVQETVELLQDQVTKVMARRMEEEH
ncbi:hypothetical protein M9H77_02727 [Catharanthus roseus]|uniref:Uncharacterized protein n=1 Tax=Catharanthus roseus TaxID=4058 RepID=A0ACC0C971_CATRO|nr:hypothetical protein M9H77_02727 [Catharanthus roseus]